MKRRLLNRLYAALEWLLLLLDGHMPTQVRIKAVKPVPFVVPVQRVRTPHISKARAAMYHQCIPPGDVIPWEGGSWYCPKCRQVRTYIPLSLPRPEATAPHYVPRVRGRHNGHLRYIGGVPVDSGKLVMPGRRAW